MEKGFGTMIEEKYINNKLFNLLSPYKDKSMLDLIKKVEKYSDKNVFKNITKVITELFYEN